MVCWSSLAHTAWSYSSGLFVTFSYEQSQRNASSTSCMSPRAHAHFAPMPVTPCWLDRITLCRGLRSAVRGLATQFEDVYGRLQVKYWTGVYGMHAMHGRVSAPSRCACARANARAIAWALFLRVCESPYECECVCVVAFVREQTGSSSEYPSASS